jgi:hypothetical protein
VANVRSVLDVVHHSFRWSGLGVEQTTAAFGRPGNQHETAVKHSADAKARIPHGPSSAPPQRRENVPSVATPPRTNISPTITTGTDPLARHACGLPTTRGGESCSTGRRLLRLVWSFVSFVSWVTRAAGLAVTYAYYPQRAAWKQVVIGDHVRLRCCASALGVQVMS